MKMKIKLISVLLIISIILAGCTNSHPLKKFDGEYSESSYKNEKLGFAYETPEGVNVYSQKNIDDEEEQAREDLSKEEIAIRDKVRTVFASHYPDTGVSATVRVEEIDKEEIASVDEYLEQARDYYKQLTEYNININNIYSTEFVGKQFKVLGMELVDSGYVYMIYATTHEDYILTFSFYYVIGSENLLTTLMQGFKEYK